MKTNELTGTALDWAVAVCEVGVKDAEQGGSWFRPSTNWAQGGPIIEREEMTVCCHWMRPFATKLVRGTRKVIQCNGDTPLIAAMRCYVASKLGDEVEIPTELQGESK